MQIDKILTHYRVVVCVGSGGVGKTTLSAALGVLAAQMGRRVLVLTIDPAKRLATALGLESLPSIPKEIAKGTFSGELWAAVVDSKKIFDDFVKQNLRDTEDQKTILKNRLYQQLSTTLSGSQEYTAMEQLYQVSVDQKFDLIVLDTPPAQHAIEFLRAPQKIYALFQSSVVKWFMPQSPSRGVQGLFNRGTKAVFKALETLTGADFIVELRTFFFVVQSLQAKIQEHAVETQRLLSSVSSTFIIVTSFDEVKLGEAAVFRRAMRELGYHLSLVVVNRAFPEWISETQDDHKSNKPGVKQLWDFYQKLLSFYNRHQEAFERLRGSLDRDTEVLKIPEFEKDIYDLEGLARIGQALRKQEAERATL